MRINKKITNQHIKNFESLFLCRFPTTQQQKSEFIERELSQLSELGERFKKANDYLDQILNKGE